MKVETTESLDSNYGSTGFGNRLGFGKKPALIIIDQVEAYYRVGSPLYHPAFGPSLASCARLQEAAHKADVPVIFTNVQVSKGGVDGGIFFMKSKIPMLCFEPGNPLGDFTKICKPGPKDVVITKRYPSAFYATHLAAMLTSWGVDTLLISGVSTSGCIRATALDTCQSGFRPMVVREACGDRHEGPHEANLFDINAKYGDVIAEAEALDYLAKVGQTAAAR